MILYCDIFFASIINLKDIQFGSKLSKKSDKIFDFLYTIIFDKGKSIQINAPE